MPLEHHRYIISRKEVFLCFAILGGVFFSVYMGFWFVDFVLPSGQSSAQLSLLDLITQPGVVDILSSFGEITVGLVAITLTVVTIVVELASNRYTPRIAELFIRDRTNIIMMSSFVLSALFVIWIEMSLHSATFPKYMIVASLLVVTFNLLAMLPYFAYVFDFLLPRRIIDRIVKSSKVSIGSISKNRGGEIQKLKVNVRLAIEQIGDIGVHAVDAKDKDIAVASIEGLFNIARYSIEKKKTFSDDWFDATELADKDQDFVALHDDVVQSVGRKKIWVERKILRQSQTILQDAMHTSRDISHLVAIRTRRITEYAQQYDDKYTVELGIRFLNTYIRFAINSSDVRTVYNLFNEVRLLAEALLSRGEEQIVIELANYMKFYGHLGFARQMPFVLECAAYDMCSIIERAWHNQSGTHDQLLTILLDVDREPREDSQEASLRGVRKAQVRLATLYLQYEEEDYARAIFQDMKEEPLERMMSIEEEMMEIKIAEYWEVSDRGKNFDYLSPDRRKHLETFFLWFQNR
jgi:hypothetical protein